MELKIEAKNVELRKGWETRINEEKNKLIRHYANFILHLRVTITATTSHKAGGYVIKLIAGVPDDTIVVERKSESVRPALTAAFDVLGLQLKEKMRKKRNSLKSSGEEEAAFT
ncbi:MAG: HPF/RaiA family ribosome-associated protein [Desulfobulbaceae bacterium]|jgi:ribosome-associated translation inhibitor RaiA|nr:HPF/RaiA family ribosome-associated protein [Desulfobulbaceae bacterium]